MTAYVERDASGISHADPPPPLVRFFRNPNRWLGNTVLMLAAAVILSYIGQLFFVGLYYVVFEVNPHMTAAWHFLVSNSAMRHSFRNHGQGLFGGLFGVAAIWNHYRKPKPRSRLDQFEIDHGLPNVLDGKPLSARQFIMLIFLVPAYAVPGYLSAELLVYGVHHLLFIWQRVHTFWLPTVDDKVVGYGAAFFFGRRPAKAVIDDLQLWFAEQIVALPGPKLDYWWMLPTLRARCNELRMSRGVPQGYHGTKWTIWMGVIAVAIVGLSAFGAYVLFFIAR